MNTNLPPKRKNNQRCYSDQNSFPSEYLSLKHRLNSNVNLYRRVRVTIAEREALAQDTEEAYQKKEAEAEERRKQSHDLVAESIKRELAESTSRLLFRIDLN